MFLEKKQDSIPASEMLVTFMDHEVYNSKINFFKLILIVCQVILLKNVKEVM